MSKLKWLGIIGVALGAAAIVITHISDDGWEHVPKRLNSGKI